MAYKNMIIREHIHDTGKRTYTVHYNEIGRMSSDAPAICEVPTLEQAASLVRYINGGNMNAQERESVRVSLSVADNAYRKGAAQGKKRGGHPHRLKQGQPPEGRRTNARAVIHYSSCGRLFQDERNNLL